MTAALISPLLVGHCGSACEVRGSDALRMSLPLRGGRSVGATAADALEAQEVLGGCLSAGAVGEEGDEEGQEQGQEVVDGDEAADAWRLGDGDGCLRIGARRWRRSRRRGDRGIGWLRGAGEVPE